MHSQHMIDTATMEFLLPPRNTHTQLSCGLAKIRKPNCPLRPVISGCDGATDHLSSYITDFIQPLPNNRPSHIKDTKHFLNLIEKPPPLPTNSSLVTADITALYTNIPHDGIAAVIQFTEEYKISYPQNVHTIVDFIRKHSTFNFMGTHPPNSRHHHGQKDGSHLSQFLYG